MSPKFWETLGYDPKEKKHLSSEWQDIIFKEDLELANENFESIVKKIHQRIKEEMRIKNISCSVNSCIGVAIYPESGRDSESLIKQADTLMYDIKKNGKGGYKIDY